MWIYQSCHTCPKFERWDLFERWGLYVILVKFIESSDGGYFEYQGDIDTISRTLLLTDYLDEIKQHLVNIPQKSKSTESSWEVNFILGLDYYCKEDDAVTEKEMTIQDVYRRITQEIDTQDFF